MAIKRTKSLEKEQTAIAVPPPIPTLPGITSKLPAPPNTGKPLEYIYAVKGKDLRRFPKNQWDRLPAHKLGYSELSPVPPEALALLEDQTS